MWSNYKHILVKNQNYRFKNKYETTFIWIKVDWASCHPTACQAKKERKQSLLKAILLSQGSRPFWWSEDTEPHLSTCSDVGLSLGKLPKQARGHDGSNRMCLLQSCILCNSPRSLQVHFQTDFCNSSPQKFHFISDPNQTDFRRLFSLKDDETVYSRFFFSEL